VDLSRLKDKFSSYASAVQRLQEALERDTEDDIVMDGVIQRFEFTYELAWKLLKAYLAYNGIAEVRTPREAFREAFAAGVLLNGQIWLEMIDDRNLTSHTYDEGEARKIFNKVKGIYFRELLDLKIKLMKELDL